MLATMVNGASRRAAFRRDSHDDATKGVPRHGGFEFYALSIVDGAERALMACAVLASVAVMFIASYDAVARYFFHSPLQWSFQFITYYMLVLIPYFALSSTFMAGDHLNFYLIEEKLPAGVRSAVRFLTAILAAGFFLLVAYGAWTHVLEAYRQKQFIPGNIMWPVWLSYLPVFIGAGFFVLRLVSRALIIALRAVDMMSVSKAGE